MSRDLHQTAPVLVPRDWMLIRGWSAGVVLLETISSFPFTQREKGNPNKKMLPDINQNTASGRNMAFAS